MAITGDDRLFFVDDIKETILLKYLVQVVPLEEVRMVSEQMFSVVFVVTEVVSMFSEKVIKMLSLTETKLSLSAGKIEETIVEKK